MPRIRTFVLALSLFVPVLSVGLKSSRAAAPAGGSTGHADVGAKANPNTPGAAKGVAPLATAKPGSGKEAGVPGAKAKGASAKLIDLNSATLEELKALPALAPVADKIVASRPFANKSQLVSKKILDKASYEEVKALIVAHKSKTQ